MTHSCLIIPHITGNWNREVKEFQEDHTAKKQSFALVPKPIRFVYLILPLSTVLITQGRGCPYAKLLATTGI